MNIRRVGILYHPRLEATLSKAKDIGQLLDSKGIDTWRCSSWDADEARGQLDNTDLVITVGGDGTILRAAQIVLTAGIPITGVNLGTLGFMTELTAAEAIERLPHLLAGEGWIDERSVLEAEVPVSPERTGTFHALNDVVVARGAIARIVHVEVTIDSTPMTTYRADGAIVATATGSTGYCLAAGGPVLYPRSPDIVLMPVVPHLGLRYPLILPAASKVVLRVKTFHDATVSIDGHINVPLGGGGEITVWQSPHRVRFLRIHQPGFYGTLEQKLKGKPHGEPDRKS